jgi:hypothetical protein
VRSKEGDEGGRDEDESSWEVESKSCEEGTKASRVKFLAVAPG